MAEPMRVALIGLDTSHTMAYAEIMNSPDVAPERKVEGLQAVSCLRFETPFQSEPDLDKRQAQVEAWGIPVTLDFDAAVADCDAIMLEINDPAYHLDYFQRVAGLGKPVFVDKPLCATIAEAREMLAIARASGTTVMACSPVRSSPALLEAVTAMPEPQNVNVYGVLGSAPAGSSIVWYGCHTAELTQRMMGSGATRVSAVESTLGCIAAVDYADGRQAVMEFGRPFNSFGGRLQKGGEIVTYQVNLGAPFYPDALKEVRAFFRDGVNVSPVKTAFEVMALLDGVERSLAAGKPVAVETT